MSLAAPSLGVRPLLSGRAGFMALVLVYALLVAACLGTLAREGELSLGRAPIVNLMKTAGEFARPSVLDVWFGNPKLEYREHGHCC
jgi:hypothetical protein